MSIADLHLHTLHSHGTAHVDAMVRAGLERGITLFGFTEHAPRPEGFRYPEDEFNERVVAQFTTYVAEVQAAREAFPQATILLGAEVDYVPAQDAFLDAFIQSVPFDFLLGGVHFAGAWGFDFAQCEWDGMAEPARRHIYAQYYALVAQMAASGRYHVMPHVDLIKLFSRETHQRFVDSDEGRAAIGQALDAIAAAGMVVECSTAGLRKPCKEIYPGPAILDWIMARNIGVCPASDAHAPNQVAFQFDVLSEYVAAHGVASWTVPHPVQEEGALRWRTLPL